MRKETNKKKKEVVDKALNFYILYKWKDVVYKELNFLAFK